MDLLGVGQRPAAPAGRGPYLDEDELWAVHTALAATCELIAANDADVQLVMDLQDDARALVAEVLAQHLHGAGATQAATAGAT